MSVEIYQGTIEPKNINDFNNAVNALFRAAGYAVTTDASVHTITVQNSSAIFGLHEITMISQWQATMSSTWNLVIDKDQRTLILVASRPASYNDEEYKVRMAVVANGVDIYAGQTASSAKVFENWNIPNVTVSRTAGQPVVLTVAVDKYTGHIDAPIFVCANGILYPLGTIIQDGSAKFVSDGNGLAIRVKE
jgi:hypothetical protein